MKKLIEAFLEVPFKYKVSESASNIIFNGYVKDFRFSVIKQFS